jgi:PAS domain S-box-containing protein
MQLDPRTAVIVFGVMWLACSVLAVAVWWTRRAYRGFGRLAMAVPALMLSLFLLGLRPKAPDWIAVLCANALLATASILLFEGARELRGRPPRVRLVYAAGVMTIGALAFFLYVVPTLNARAALMSAFVAVVFLLTARTLLKAVPPGQGFGLQLTGYMFLACSATHAARGVYCALGPRIDDLFALSSGNGAFFVALAAEVSLLPVGFMLVAHDRVVSDLNDATEPESIANPEMERRRKADAVLRENERRFRMLLDAAPVMIWQSGPDGLCTHFNRRWLEFTGRPIESELGKGWTKSLHPDDIARCRATIDQAFDRRQPFTMEYRLRRFDDEYRWILGSGVPGIVDSVFTGFVGSAIDVTDQRTARDTLSALSGKLMEAQEDERARMARDLHDDLAQRATAIAWQLHNLARTLPAGKSEGIEVRVTSNLAADLAKGIQLVSHQLHPAQLEILGLAPTAAAFCRSLSERHQVKIDFKHEGVRPSLPKGVAVCLFRVLQEALNNAVKYAGVQHITVTLLATPHEIELNVIDCGVGFDARSTGRGYGLGIISMKERLHLVGGEVRIESEPGVGTTVRARVPVGSLEDGSSGAGVARQRARARN